MRETDPHPHARRDGDSQEALRLGQHLKQHFWTNGLLTQRIDVLVEEHDVVPGCNRSWELAEIASHNGNDSIDNIPRKTYLEYLHAIK
ncbi:pisatin demethylase [Colletotrichum sp. SAR 10_75]|nr:pisatin demethylase [Colletotrichum sp. SAR 10_75]